MPVETEHTQKADTFQGDIVKAGTIILVDPDDNPVVQFRAARDKTLQIMDGFGNICMEIHLGQTPGKELRR
jgi:hypothetical protein